MTRIRTSLPVALGLIAASVVGFATPAAAVSVVQPNIVNAVPASYTPDANNGIVYAVNQVDNTVYMGGSFTSVSAHGSSTAIPDNYIAAFTSGTGALVSSFAPQLNGAVQTIIPGPAANEVYVGGNFTTANGSPTHVALLNTTDGSTVSTWKPSGQNGIVQKLVLANGMLFVGGSFTVIGGASHPSLVALNPTTGKVLPYVGLSLTGHHNFGVNCSTSASNCANGTVGIKDFDIDPSGTHLIAIGNFTSVSGTPEDQVAMIDLGASAATVDPNWTTGAYTAACFSSAFDSYVRGVQFSPDGSYFVVVATGGSGTNKDGTNSSCDTAARFETNAVGTNIRPTWLNYTGQDTLLSVAITGGVVYVGGHQRWLNNSLGHDNPGAGAVPRPGIAALNPLSGIPFSWNPGRNPRGAGAYALFASTSGLYVGSDTDYIGNTEYHHKKIAFFPLAGGEALPADATPTLPGRVYTAGSLSASPPGVDQFSYRQFDGTTAGTAQQLSTGVAWGSTRGAFDVNGEIFYGKTDGNLYERSFDGSTVGSEVLLQPWNDPVWANVDTGSGQTYKGTAPNFNAELPTVSSMFFTNGRLYYTQTGNSTMHWRWFEPESGIVGSAEFSLTTPGLNWSTLSGAFLSGSTLYYATTASGPTAGNLFSIPWSGTQPTGSATVANNTQSWTSRGMFLLSDATSPNQPPVAAFTATCSTTQTTCTFDASASIDPDGAITDYAWTFGNNPAEHHPNATVFPHDFTTAGQYSVSLTVTDNDGATTTKSQLVVVGQATPVPAFGGAMTACGPGTGACGSSASTTVTVPSSTVAGDALLLFVSWPTSGTVTASVPAGWHALGTPSVSSPLETDVYYRSATAADIGGTVPVTFSAKTHNSVTLADYSGADPNTIEAFAWSTDANHTAHTTPNATVATNGSLAVSYWADKSSTTTAWTAPAAVTPRATFYDTGGGYTTSLLADSNTTVPSGSYGSQTATTNAASGKGTEWTIILAPAGTTVPPPAASFTSNCTNLSCTFDASGSTDVGGTITSYAWDFGDGHTSAASGSSSAANDYTAAGPGTYQVTLTVTDNHSATGTTTKPVTVTAPVQNIGFVGASKYDNTGTSGTVTIPAATAAGDTLLLFESHASTSLTASAPAGWTQLGSTSVSNLRSAVYEKTASASDASTPVTVTFSGSVKAQVVVADYTETAAAPIEAALSSTSTATTSHTTPAASGLSNGTWVVSFWTDKSTTTSSWTPPGAVTQRLTAFGSGSGAVSALLADSGAGVSGSYAGQTATSSATSGSAAQWTIALKPAS